MPVKEPVVLELTNVTFTGTFGDDNAEGSMTSSGDLIITAEAETVDAIAEYLLEVAAEEEREVA